MPGIEVGHGITSVTSLPCRYREYCDCPGFSDTRSAVQEILNNFSIYKLTESSKKIKLVVTISEYSIRSGRSEKFI